MSTSDGFLQQGAVADGNGVAILSDGGLKTFSTYGTFGGGTVTLEVKTADDAEFIPAVFEDGTTIAFTAEGTATVRIANGMRYRAVISGSTTPVLNARIDSISRG